jgi:RNA polymerase sigma factor (sigma-70 family)
VVDYSQNSTNSDQETDFYKIDSIPHTTAAEERVLWRNYIKWKQIKTILGPEPVLDNVYKASFIIISRTIEEISSFYDLVVLLRHQSGLDKLGDIIIEGDESNVKYMTEVARLVFQHTKKKPDENSIIESCCLREFMGSIFGDMLNNIAFGKGNRPLVDKITKVIEGDPVDIRDKLYRLAINRELLSKNIIKLLNPEIALTELHDSIKAIDQAYFSDFVSNYYQLIVLGIKLKGEEAFNRIIESHLWLVTDIVDKHFSRKDMGLPRDDLIQEGSIGLITAAERYRPVLSDRFMQYASWWVFQKIYRVVADQGRTIRIPVHMVETMNRLFEVSRRLAYEYGRDPSYEEIGERMEMSSDKVAEIVKFSQMPMSVEIRVDEEDNKLGDLIDDRAEIRLDEVVSQGLLKSQLDRILAELPDREKRVILLRFGLEDGRARTLEEVGKEFNVTRERIRQIEEKALKKLRHPSRSRKLKEYLE